MATNHLAGHSTIRSNSMAPGQNYKIWLHSEPKSDWINAKLVKRPNCMVCDMGENDAFVLDILDKNGKATGKQISLIRNNHFPHFLETKIIGRSGKEVRTRMTIVEEIKK